MQLTRAERVRTRGADAFGTEAPVFGALDEQVRSTPPSTASRPAVSASPRSRLRADFLAARLADLGHSLGVAPVCRCQASASRGRVLPEAACESRPSAAAR